MANTGEGSRDIYTPTSVMLFGGVPPPHESTHIPNTHVAPVVSLSFTSSTPMSPSTRVVIPLVSVNTSTSASNVVITSIPSVPFTSPRYFKIFRITFVVLPLLFKGILGMESIFLHPLHL